MINSVIVASNAQISQIYPINDQQLTINKNQGFPSLMKMRNAIFDI